jgi:putative effector of murein hydrolase
MGLMLGVSAHGVGTARAREIGVEQGAVAALAMILMGLANISGLALLMLFSG